jgi:hypothetical protein
MEEAPENGMESSDSAHANGMNQSINKYRVTIYKSSRENVSPAAHHDRTRCTNLSVK